MIWLLLSVFLLQRTYADINSDDILVNFGDGFDLGTNWGSSGSSGSWSTWSTYENTGFCGGFPNCRITQSSDGKFTEILIEDEFDLVHGVLSEGKVLADQWFLSYEINKDNYSREDDEKKVILSVQDIPDEGSPCKIEPIQVRLRKDKIVNEINLLRHYADSGLLRTLLDNILFIHFFIKIPEKMVRTRSSTVVILTT